MWRNSNIRQNLFFCWSEENVFIIKNYFKSYYKRHLYILWIDKERGFERAERGSERGIDRNKRGREGREREEVVEDEESKKRRRQQVINTIRINLF